jgi:hypothetical protein
MIIIIIDITTVFPGFTSRNTKKPTVACREDDVNCGHVRGSRGAARLSEPSVGQVALDRCSALADWWCSGGKKRLKYVEITIITNNKGEIMVITIIISLM